MKQIILYASDTFVLFVSFNIFVSNDNRNTLFILACES